MRASLQSGPVALGTGLLVRGSLGRRLRGRRGCATKSQADEYGRDYRDGQFRFVGRLFSCHVSFLLRLALWWSPYPHG